MDRNDTDVNALKAQIDGDFTWYQIQKRQVAAEGETMKVLVTWFRQRC